MEIRDDLLCLFSSEIERQGSEAVITVPSDEVELGDLEPGQTYRVAILEHGDGSPSTSRASTGAPTPPVEEGDHVDLEVESIGDQGDGIARVDRGYVVIVPDTEVGDRVTAEITTVKENMAFAEVVEHHRVA